MADGNKSSDEEAKDEGVKREKHKKKKSKHKKRKSSDQQKEQQNSNEGDQKGYHSSSSAWSSDLEEDFKVLNKSSKNEDSESEKPSKQKKKKLDRHRSRSRSRDTDSKSHDKRSRSRDGSRKRSRDRHRSRDRYSSKDRYRSRSRDRNRSRSRDRYRRSRSPYRQRRSRSKSNDRYKDSRRSRDFHSFTKNKDFSSQSKKIEIKITTPAVKDVEETTESKQKDKFSLIGEWKPVEKPQKSKDKSKLKELTAFCEQLSKEKDDDKNERDKEEKKSVNEKKEEPESTGQKVHHPFAVNPLPPPPPMSLVPLVPMNPAQAIQAGMMLQSIGGFPALPPAQPVPPGERHSHFPVSSGEAHRQQQDYIGPGAENIVKHDLSVEKIDISATLARRLKAQQILDVSPSDILARQQLQECDALIKKWSKSEIKPGQFTGEKTMNLLKRDELEGGLQVWAKRDFFNYLKPVQGGFGEKLLKKMGWTNGMPLGKRREGFVNPIPIDVRAAKKGLSTIDEEISMMRGGKKKALPVIDCHGKHPVSALNEYCTKQKWPLPDFNVVMDHGPAHHKKFLFSVIVNGVKYQSSSPSPNKKNAKAQAATAALTALGLVSGP